MSALNGSAERKTEEDKKRKRQEIHTESTLSSFLNISFSVHKRWSCSFSFLFLFLSLSLYQLASFFAIVLLRVSLCSLLYADSTHCYLKWLVVKYYCMLRSKIWIYLTTSWALQEASSQLETTTTKDLRRLIKSISQLLSTLMWLICTLIRLRDCEESTSSLAVTLWRFLLMFLLL